MELEYSIDELFPKCKIRPKSSLHDSESNSESHEELYRENTDEESDDDKIECIKRSYSSSLENREEAEGQEECDRREEAEGQELVKQDDIQNDAVLNFNKYKIKSKNGSEYNDDGKKRENELQVEDDRDVEGDNDDSMDDIRQLKERKNTRLRKSCRKSRREKHRRSGLQDSEEEQIFEETSPSLGPENVPVSPRKCVPHRSFWKRTKDHIGSGFVTFWEKIKDGSRGFKNRLRGDWGRKNLKKRNPLNEETNSYEGEDEEEASSKQYVTKPK